MQDGEDSDGFIVPLKPRTSRRKRRCGVCGGKGPSRENELRQSRLRTQSRNQPVTGASARTCSRTSRSRQEPDAGKPQVRFCEGVRRKPHLYSTAQEHLAASIALFESEGLDGAPVRDAWRAAQASREASPQIAPAITIARVSEDAVAGVPGRRASIAVLPFADRSTIVEPRGGVHGALAHDVITRLAKLRSLFVIACGTMLALHERGLGAQEAWRMLDVDYVVSGSVSRKGTNLKVVVEVTDTRTSRFVWADVFNEHFEDMFVVLGEIGDKIVAAVAAEIETSERNRAVLVPPNSLNAWEAHHHGLWHVYRFNQADNERARTLLRDRDPPRPNVRACVCRPFVQLFSERVSGLGRPRTRSRSCVRSCAGEPHDRRSRSGRPLGDRPCPLVARAPRPIARGTRTIGGSQPKLRFGTLRARVRSLADG
jgi:TolB-like protein